MFVKLMVVFIGVAAVYVIVMLVLTAGGRTPLISILP
jgi:hypothetical protein